MGSSSAALASRRVSSPHLVPRKALTSDLAVCVWIPLFPLRMEELRRPELVGKPSGILDPRDTRRLWQVSALARRAGVQVGLTVSQAIGLCSSMTLLEADPVFYDEQFSKLVSALGNFSPVIEPVELGRVYVGVDGVDRLYGSPERQLATVRRIIGRCWKQSDSQKDGQTDRRTDGQTGRRAVGKSESRKVGKSERG